MNALPPTYAVRKVHGLMLTQGLSSPFIFIASVKMHMRFFSSIFFLAHRIEMTQKDPCIRHGFVDFQVLSGLFIHKHYLKRFQGITHYFQ